MGDPMEVGFVGSLEPLEDDDVSMLLLQQINGLDRSFRRERVSAYRKMVSEVYSPPRVTTTAVMMGLIPGFALDLTLNAVGSRRWAAMGFQQPRKGR